jgi:hypothetical protein
LCAKMTSLTKKNQIKRCSWLELVHVLTRFRRP